MTVRSRSSLLIPILIGILVALLALFAVMLLTDEDPTAATTTEPVTTTAAPTTVATTTTTLAPTTTVFIGGIETVTNLEPEGTPGPNLTEVRVGDQDGFVRVVFDFTGTGTPIYEVGYADPPFAGGGSGAEVPVLGSAFLKVQVMPGIRFDMDSGTLVYLGDTMIDPGLDPIVEIQFIDDFEANMVWVIGLTSERPFTVDVLQDPLRLVIDIAK